MNTLSSRLLLVALFFGVVLVSCEKKDYQTIVELDDENIQNYIQENDLDVVPFGSTGMYYEILEEGSGRELDYKEKIPLVYSFTTLDKSYSSADTFSVSNRYADFLGYFPYGSSVANNQPGSPLDKEEGLKVVLKEALKHANGKIRILVPSRLAYGKNGSGKIGSNKSLDYIVHVIDNDDLPEYEDQSIRNYIASLDKNVADFTRTETGIYYQILESGSGSQVPENSSIRVGYSLKTLNGSLVEKSSTDSTLISLDESVKGWGEVLPKVKEGGKVHLILPSSQAYGTAGNISSVAGMVSIPAFSPLDFEVTVKRIVNQ